MDTVIAKLEAAFNPSRGYKIEKFGFFSEINSSGILKFYFVLIQLLAAWWEYCMNIRRYFTKTKWDPYMDGIELRPRLHTWAEKIIFFISIVLALTTLTLLILPSNSRGVVDSSRDKFVAMVEEKLSSDGRTLRIFEDQATEYAVEGPIQPDNEEGYSERFDLLITDDLDRTLEYIFLLGPVDEAESKRPMAVKINEKRYDGSYTYTSGTKGDRGHFYSRDYPDDAYSIEIVFTDSYGARVNATPDINLLARMVTGQTLTRRDLNASAFISSTVLALLAAAITYFYNELFLIHRSFKSISYHGSSELEPTGLYTFGHILASGIVLLFSFIYFFSYYF